MNIDYKVDYLKNSDNGQAVADIQRDLQGQIDEVSSDTTEVLSEIEILAQINDRIYQGTDLTIKFADEISASPYNGDPWAWIMARISKHNYKGIHVCDYIPFTTTNGITFKAQIAGIKTYANTGLNSSSRFIDFICEELWTDYHSFNKDSYNNGTSTQNCPWLASDLYLFLNSLSGDVPNGDGLNPQTVAVDYTTDGVYYYLPTQLKNVIIEKYTLLPKRYSSSNLLTEDNIATFTNIGKLWLPDEFEVYGTNVFGGKGYSVQGTGVQYPLFAGNYKRYKFKDNAPSAWWLLSSFEGNTTDWCAVGPYGDCGFANTSNIYTGVPICFRVGIPNYS